MVKSIAVMNEKQEEYFNFINSLNSEETKKLYAYRLKEFLDINRVDLHSFLVDPNMEKTIIQYLVEKKASRSTKNTIYFVLKHACEVNDILLNWKKIRKFIGSQKTGNEISGRDRGYTHEEIQQILNFSDQRLKTCYFILASTGIRIGALSSLKLSDLERIEEIYKVTVYSGDKEQYVTFCTAECAKEIDSYLKFRKRRGERITGDSYLIVKEFTYATKSKPMLSKSLESLLKDIIENSGIRKTDPNNPHKRQKVPILHGFRKFFTKQLVDSKVNPEIREMLLGHKIGLTGVYYKPTEEEMYMEYEKAIDALTINEENRLRKKVKTLEVEQSRVTYLEESLKELQEQFIKMTNKK
jgi:integrase/recombinase XerD